jgi:hypothetical protein
LECVCISEPIAVQHLIQVRLTPEWRFAILISGLTTFKVSRK